MSDVVVNPLLEPDVRKKIALLRGITNFDQGSVPASIARDIQVVRPDALPPKKGLSYNEGQARLLHDLASIELQATELALRSLYEYPQANSDFREQLLKLTLEESHHLELCLNGIEQLGYKWGDWPVHTALWDAVSTQDSLLDRICIVHRYLEGSGLDSGDTLLRRLSGVLEGGIHHIVRVIVREEVGHVKFGSEWYRFFCLDQGLDPETDFPARMKRLAHVLPKRIEPLSIELRKSAGFTDSEICYLSEARQAMIKFSPQKEVLKCPNHNLHKALQPEPS